MGSFKNNQEKPKYMRNAALSKARFENRALKLKIVILKQEVLIMKKLIALSKMLTEGQNLHQYEK